MHPYHLLARATSLTTRLPTSRPPIPSNIAISSFIITPPCAPRHSPARIPHATVDIAFELRAKRLRHRQRKAAAAVLQERSANPNPNISTLTLRTKKHEDDERGERESKPHTDANKAYTNSLGERKTDPMHDRIRRSLLRCRAEKKLPDPDLLVEPTGPGRVVICGTPRERVHGGLRGVNRTMAWAPCLLRVRRRELRKKTGKHIRTVEQEKRRAKEKERMQAKIGAAKEQIRQNREEK